MNTHNFFLTLLLFFTMIPHEAYGMFSKASRLWRQAPITVKGAVIGTGLYAAGYAYDQTIGNELTFVDVSTPSQPRIIDDLLATLSSDIDEELAQSVTRLQLDNDWYLRYHPIATAYRYANNMGSQYHEIADSVLFAHFWVLLPTLRRQLVNLVLHMSYNEVEQRNNGNVTLVSGTNQGASILLRTIFDEVLNDHPHQNFVKLRDRNIINALEEYQGINQYYDENSFEAVTHPGIRSGSGTRGPETIERVLLSEQANADTISANFGFFGQSRDIIDGGQESSAEFVTRSCSWGWQAKRCYMVFVQYPLYIPYVIKHYASTGDFQVSLDRATKPALSHIFHEIFNENGADDLYQNYQDELQSIDAIMSAGIMQLFITEQNAQRWGYAAKRLGTRTLTSPDALYQLETTDTQDLSRHQARVLMHPDICNPKNTSMRFYILGEPTEISNTINRMYQIAEEVKRLRNQQ